MTTSSARSLAWVRACTCSKPTTLDFRGSDENLQQLAFARMRAIVAGRAVVNVSTVGTSQLVGSDGAVPNVVGADRAAARITTVPVRTGLTPTSILGPWIAGILGLGSLLATAGLAVGYRRSRQPDMVRNEVTR